MMRRLFTPDRVAFTGAAVGLVSLAFGWLTLRPNRLASGTALKIRDSLGWEAAAVIIGLWTAGLIFSLIAKRQRSVITLGLILNLLVFTTFFYAGRGAIHLLQGQPDVARVSLGIGLWVTCLGAYIGIFACRQRLAGSAFWQNLVSWSGLISVAILLLAGRLNDISLILEFHRQQAQFGHQLLTHIILFASSVVAGTIIGIPLGIWASRSGHAEKPIFFFTNIVQTIPSLALFGLLIAPLTALSAAFPVLRQWGISGIGAAPAIIALVLYSLLPVARNTYVGLKQLDPSVIDAGTGMGMSRPQVFRRIEVPLAAPLVMEGIRTASVQAVGNTAVAALIGAGGLGWFIFQGISQAAADVVILGAVPIMILALIVDIVMRQAVKIATPKGIAPDDPTGTRHQTV